MTTANNADNNLSPWKPGHSGNPSGRPKGTRDLAGYVLETTDGGKELVDALLCIARGVMPVAVQELLGHSGIAVTMDVYSHVLPTMQQEAMSDMDKLLSA